MNPIAKNVIAVIAGFIIGSIVNMSLVTIGPMIIPVPEGLDTSTMEGIKEAIPKMKAANFVFPFLAHALGTLVGAFVASKFAASRRMELAMGIGAFFMLGGITMAVMVGGPLWFLTLDLVVAYIPMGIIGGVLGILTTDIPVNTQPLEKSE